MRFWNQCVSDSSISAAPTKGCYGKEGVSGIKAFLIRLSQLPPLKVVMGRNAFLDLSCPPLKVVMGRKAFLESMRFGCVYLSCPPLEVVMGRNAFLESMRF